MSTSWSFGSCQFKGNSMNTSTKFGGEITIYYKGNIRNSGLIGGKKVWTGSGDICVVYHKKSAIDQHIFKVNGSVQECTKMAR